MHRLALCASHPPDSAGFLTVSKATPSLIVSILERLRTVTRCSKTSVIRSRTYCCLHPVEYAKVDGLAERASSPNSRTNGEMARAEKVAGSAQKELNQVESSMSLVKQQKANAEREVKGASVTTVSAPQDSG